ncbi:serpin family protein [Jiangella gansuensis]|uniref:serpin family protein n=1 Tax=Jiangella gansuensis TaxID=281473 RepID=UPI0004B9EB1D|nr:serpin family protein [Jiangella gansuensis]
MSLHASEVNQLTAAWLRRTRGAGVVSGAGLWPLLAILAASADEPGRDELADAVGLPADEAMDAARDLLKALADLDGVEAALGLWAQAAAHVRQEWRDTLPPGSYGELAGDAAIDQPMLDAWASERTGGLIERFPVRTGPELMLTLATALALRTTWERKFTDERLVPSAGAWSGRPLAGLKRTGPDLDDLRLATTTAGPLTVTRIAGTNGLDVHLVLGEDSRVGADLLAAALPLVTGTESGEVRTGGELLAGDGDGAGSGWPGVAVVSAQRPSLAVTTARFTVRSDHDLMENAAVFGLRTVSGTDRGHFPAIGPVPLRVDQARQSAVAVFSATGFEAAAVTAIGLRTVSMPVHNSRGLAVSYDRPFGFLATHRDSGLVLFAGWVDEPDAWSPPEPGRRPAARPARPSAPVRGTLPRPGKPE